MINTPRTVLVVDDEYDSVKPLIVIMERDGYQTRYAATHEDAMELLNDISPDLVIIDVVLGRDSGFDLFKDMRKHPKTETIPILFLSGLDQIETKVQGLNLGAGDFLEKPYNVKEISARINLQMRLKEKEDQLRKKNDELKHAYDELHKAQTAAIHAEKLAAIGRLSAGIAHEMSTPLSFIGSNLGMLQTYIRDIDQLMEAYHQLAIAVAEEHDKNDVLTKIDSVFTMRQSLDIDTTLNEVNDLARDCIEGVEDISRIANDLREFSRGDFEDKVPASVNEIIDKTLNLARNELREEIQLELELGTVPPISCVPGRITQVFLNILVNATQSIEGEGTIRIVSWKEDGHVVVAIEDSGCGIDSELLPHVFDPFYTSKPAEMGTGLGLSIAHKIVESYGGSITVESEIGKGTCVQVDLPIDTGDDG